MQQLSFLTGANATYVSELYARFIENPSSVDSEWAQFFAELNDDARAILAEVKGAPWGRNGNRVIGAEAEEPAKKAEGRAGSGKALPAAAQAAAPSVAEIRKVALDSIRALMLIRVYRVRGHLEANLDPLGLQKREPHPELDYRSYGFTEADLDREIFIDHSLGLETATLRTIIRILRETYCGNIGVEFMHIQDPDQKIWIQKRIESIRNHTDFTERGKQAILERLTEAEGLERFLQMKYTGTKRFGLEGGEVLIPALEQILKRGSQLGLTDVTLGMAHRGRLNVLTNFMKKPFVALFSEFQGNPAKPEDVQGSGDVKYHLGTSADRDFDGNVVHLSLTPNPSHLEVADPVVLGKVRAKQTLAGDTERRQSMGLLIHGDAAFAGQGVVHECFAMSQLKGYSTGGTMHVVINNQIGFTTAPQYSRSGPYCTDVAKMVQAPIFHVNGDDAEAVIHVARIATEFRQEFAIDVVVDIVCYRRHGHNESDEPAFTQPLMYRKIAAHPTTRQLYAEKLIAEKVVSAEAADGMVSEFQSLLEADFEAAKSFKVNKADWLEGKWASLGALTDEEEMRDENTDVSFELLQEVGRAITTVPEDFNLNRKIARQLEAKQKMLTSGQGIDWATGEALAFGSLVVEGTGVRLSGQDSGRGTFSQRHSVLIDQETEAPYIPLNHVRPGQGHFEVIDSLLSEEGVLGYEYGYTLSAPDGLTLWEGQFGDFANGAQVIIDQFISSGEAKWLRMSGLVLLLPHGYEGQGPEHSSARWERYLQLCAEDNWQVCNFTTPANYFHALRRQVRRNYRKPLVVMTPKSLLRHKLAVSPLADFGPGTRFRRVLPETQTLVSDEAVRRVVLCSGKVYYDLFEERARRNIDDVAIIRVEQLYPWPKETVLKELARYPNAEVVWAQEEPANMGPWTFVDRRLEFILEELSHKVRRAHYVGRKAAAAPATGVHKNHVYEQALLVEQALTAALFTLPQPFRRQTRLIQVQDKVIQVQDAK
ncbi:2-oxoglutarate dehydrogenase E1 component [Telmatospirillum siberiense]|uniref:2-oxoglutarate dehydrogenase E1 component n=1 Tax=Telmatospirillum siberiense TaxID=382514 RepID=A0A2N3PY58_9PROT|nr:2-oxoglutarate dehydrogenase E1 component [Telmatospirillum siberiense]PKU25346.1 2-oxoglutarate dehydrogenase E1 component [Telmatospirillum siberiense]